MRISFICFLNFDKSIIQTVMINFQVIKPIGEGAFSEVFKVRRIKDGKIYALKRMKLSSLNIGDRTSCLNEIRILSRIRHPNIIEYKQCFLQGSSLFLVMQLAQRGDLLSLMRHYNRQKSTFSEEELCVYIRQMANGIAALHKMNIIHRDIKSANFYLTKQGNIKLGDMNVSTIRRNGMAETKVGTPYYTSPQIWLQQTYTVATDLWSLGCLIYQMVTFRHPFKGSDIFELKNNVLKGEYQALPQRCPQQLRQIIGKCLILNPNERIRAQDIIKNEYIRKKYNQYKQKTMEKDPITMKMHNLTCARLLRQISIENSNINCLNLPKSNYSQKKRIKTVRNRSKGKKRQNSNIKPLSSRLITMMQIYNTKPYRLSTKTVTGSQRKQKIL